MRGGEETEAGEREREGGRERGREREHTLSQFEFQVFGFQDFSVHQTVVWISGFRSIMYSCNVVSLWSYVCVSPASSVLSRDIYRIIIDLFM